MRYKPATIPETLSQVIGRAWSLYLSTFVKVFLLALTIAVITFIPKAILLYVEANWISLTHFQFKLIVLVVEIIDLSLFTAILWRLQCVTTNKREKLRDDLLTAIKKVPLVIVAALLQDLLLLLVAATALHSMNPMHRDAVSILISAMPIILGSFLYVAIFFYFFFYLPLILTENNNPVRALWHSTQLVWENWWRVYWTQLTPWLIYFICTLACKMLLSYITPYLPMEVMIFITLIVEIGLIAVFIPWFAATMLVQLRDLELRKKISGPRKPRTRAATAS
jgi:hypothetical protein